MTPDFFPDFGGPCQCCPAANFEPRPAGTKIDTLVLHYTGMPDGDAALERLCIAQSRVSCHYLVHEDGRIVQMVPEALRAWHAGVSRWRGAGDLNSRSIGIEIVNPGHEFGYRPFPAPQIDAVIALCRDILDRQPIPARNVVAHSDIAPDRKEDPGELFPWDELSRQGIGLWVEPQPLAAGAVLQLNDESDAVADLHAQLACHGYDAPSGNTYTAQTRACVTAFQRHFRPTQIDGIADLSTIRTLRKLVEAL